MGGPQGSSRTYSASLCFLVQEFNDELKKGMESEKKEKEGGQEEKK